MVPVRTQTQWRTRLSHEVFEAVAELGESFFDEALQVCDDEREAAFLASATLVSTLEQEKVLIRARREGRT